MERYRLTVERRFLWLAISNISFNFWCICDFIPQNLDFTLKIDRIGFTEKIKVCTAIVIFWLANFEYLIIFLIRSQFGHSLSTLTNLDLEALIKVGSRIEWNIWYQRLGKNSILTLCSIFQIDFAHLKGEVLILDAESRSDEYSKLAAWETLISILIVHLSTWNFKVGWAF